MTRKSLPIGTELDRYLIKQMLSEDGRGISYLAVDTGSVSGSAKVLVREYFPRGISVRDTGDIEPRDRQEAQDEFERGLAGFMDAGKTLINLKTHTLVPALDIVEENATAYLVLEWPEGRAFSQLSNGEDTMSVDLLRSQLAILLPGLEELHGAGLLHTALSPDTLIRLDDGYPAISQLTHVERFDAEDINRTHLLLDTPYSAPELASDSAAPIGPWTDIYSLSATCWFLLTGFAPATAAARTASIAAGRGDLLKPNALTDLGEGFEQIAEALLEGLELISEKRLASAAELISALEERAAWSGPAFIAPALAFAGNHKTALMGTAAAFAIGVVALGMVGTDTAETDAVIVAEAPVDDDVLVLQLEYEQVNLDLPEAKVAEPRMVANAAWLLVNRDDAVEVRAFIDKYDDEPVMSLVASERLELLDERAWSAALSEGTTEALEVYLTTFSAEMMPAGVHVADAQAKLIDMTSAHEFRVTEARRLLSALGYKTGRRKGETPGLTKAVIGFQDSAGLGTDGEITDELLEAMSSEVSRRDTEAKQLAEAKQRADQQAESEARYVELVQAAATSTTRSATGVTNRENAPEEGDQTEAKTYVSVPKAEPKVIYETKVASSSMARPKIEVEEPKEPVRKAGDTFKDCDTCPDVTVIPAGTFSMGSPNNERGRQKEEGPVHGVRISEAFAMGKHEVTVRQYAAFVRATSRRLPGSCAAESDEHNGEWVTKSGLSFRNPGFQQSGSHPVTCVSWQDASAYTAWLSKTTGKTYRLASEAEWEYAARAGSKDARHFGRSYRDGCKFANGADRTASRSRELWVTANCTDGHLTTSPAGSFRANAFGLYDMIGNVWEWTEDCFASDYSGTPRTEAANTSKGCGSRVTRGGSWAAGTDMLRSAARSGDSPKARYDMLGFRVVRELPDQ